MLNKRCAVDRYIDFVVPEQAQAVEIAGIDRHPGLDGQKTEDDSRTR